MRTLVCCLEEPSAWEMLKVVLPKCCPDDVVFQPMIFEGKQDLEKRLAHRIRHWMKPESYFLILRDQDSEPCTEVKSRLVEKVVQSGKEQFSVIRIACHELESFYLGHLAAVEQGLGIDKLSARQKGRKFRNPDQTENPKQELRRLTGERYQPISGSRAIAAHLDLSGLNHSHSFRNLLSGVSRLINPAS